MSKHDLETIRSVLAKHGGSYKLAAKELKMDASALSKRARAHGIVQAIKPSTAKGRSLSEFREEWDKDFIIPKKIKAGLEALGDGWEYEPAFAKLAGIGLIDLSTYREQFADFLVIVGGRSGKRVWAGTKALAAKMREMVP